MVSTGLDELMAVRLPYCKWHAIPAIDPNWPRVEVVDMSYTSLTDEDLKCLNKVEQLRAIYLNGLEIDGYGLRHIVHLKYLRTIEMNHTRVTDEGFLALADCESLKGVSIVGTMISESAIAKFRELRPDISIINMDPEASER